MGYKFELHDSRQRPVTGSREHGNKLSGSITCWEILEWVNDCCLLKISAPRRQLYPIYCGMWTLLLGNDREISNYTTAVAR
jgi:hypothetical protein